MGVVQGKPVWQVSVINNCNCDQSQILLSCKGFQTAEPIDRSVLIIQGDNCLLFNGHALGGHNTDEFAYAWDAPFPFAPISSVTVPPCKSQKEIEI